MPEGMVERYDYQKGHGVIIQDNDGPELLVTYLDLKGPGWQTLGRGDVVTFDVDGNKAINVQKLNYRMKQSIKNMG